MNLTEGKLRSLHCVCILMCWWRFFVEDEVCVSSLSCSGFMLRTERSGIRVNGFGKELRGHEGRVISQGYK